MTAQIKILRYNFHTNIRKRLFLWTNYTSKIFQQKNLNNELLWEKLPKSKVFSLTGIDCMINSYRMLTSWWPIPQTHPQVLYITSRKRTVLFSRINIQLTHLQLQRICQKHKLSALCCLPSFRSQLSVYSKSKEIRLMLADVSEQGNFHNNTELQLGMWNVKCTLHVLQTAFIRNLLMHSGL